MKIEVSQYTREDGVTMVLCPNGKWAIRCTRGPAWFYCIPGQHGNNPGGWMISIVPGFEVAKYTYPLEVAMEALKTVTKL